VVEDLFGNHAIVSWTWPFLPPLN